MHSRGIVCGDHLERQPGEGVNEGHQQGMEGGLGLLHLRNQSICCVHVCAQTLHALTDSNIFLGKIL